MLQRGWQVVWLLLAVGCAGELRDPGRFAFLLDDDGGITAPPADGGITPGKDAAPPDAGKPKPIPPLPTCATMLFKERCASAACHGAGAAQIDLLSSGVEMRLVGKPSSESTTAQCKGRTLVATDGTDSLLLEKLNETPPCGLQMPLGSSLTDTETKCISDWVDLLASDN
jgi:hypothetical protein